jgi:hypothetical protein
VKVRAGAVLRGVGVGSACLAPTPSARSRVLFAAYALAWPLGRPGLQVFVVIPDTEEPWKRATVPFATSVTSWSAVMLFATTAVRRTRVPSPVAAVLLATAAVVVDSVLADLGERRRDSHQDAVPSDALPS